MGRRTPQKDSEPGVAFPVLRDGRAVQPSGSEPPAPAGGLRVGKANWSPDYQSDRESFLRTLTGIPFPPEPDLAGGAASDPSTSSDAGMVSGESPERAVSLSSDETPASAGGVREPMHGGASALGPRVFTVRSRGSLPDGQYLIEVYDDGVTLAWRPDSYGSTLWGVPVDGEPDPYNPAELARKARPLTDGIGRGTRA